MNELECKECNEPTSCDETAVAITCSGCVIEGALDELFILKDDIELQGIEGES